MMMLQKTPPDMPKAVPERAPPHSIEDEQALLGTLMVHNAAFERVVDIIKAEHFFEPLHGHIFEEISALITANRPATMMSLKPFFESFPPVSETMTAVQYLGQLMARAPDIIHPRDYAQTIVELARRRLLILTGERLIDEAFDASINHRHSVAIIEEAEESLFQISEKQTSSDAVVPFRELMRDAVKFANEARASGGRFGNLDSGFPDLDDKLGGLRRGDLIIVAGRPSMGKTAFATNIAFNVARDGYTDRDGVARPAPVGFFSLEMGKDQLARRMLAAVSGVSDHKVQRGDTSEEDIRRIMAAAAQIERTPMIIDARGGITIAQLASRARRMKRRHNIELLVVDYLQLLAGHSNKSDNRVVEITQITTGLKSLAKELDVPVVALSQLSRQVEQREDKKPQLSDLRESGSIEQDADVVIFMYREEYYLERIEPNEKTEGEKYAEWQAKYNAAKNKAEAIVGKQRHGPVGTIDLHFNGALTLFSSLDISERAIARRKRAEASA